MPLYRADYIAPGGTRQRAVTERDAGRYTMGARDLLTRHMTTIRPLAATAARDGEGDVLISRIVKGGAIRPALIATADGRFRRPDTSKSVGTNADHKDNGPCFCAACRADRRASRAKGGNR